VSAKVKESYFFEETNEHLDTDKQIPHIKDEELHTSHFRRTKEY